MATLIELEHSFLGKVSVAVMSLQSGEVYMAILDGVSGALATRNRGVFAL